MNQSTPAQERIVQVVGVIAAVVIILIALGALVRSYPPVARILMPIQVPVVHAWSALTLPSELRAAQFVTASGTYKASFWGYAPQASPAEVEQVYQLPHNQETEKANPGVSPNRTSVVFQQLTDADLAENTGAWQVSVADTLNGSQRVIGKGVRPFFLNETHVGMFTDAGLVLHDLATTSTRVLLDTPFIDSALHASLSPNRSVIAFVDPTAPETILVYAISPEAVEPITKYTGTFSSFGAADNALYVLRTVPGGTAVVKYPFVESPTEQVIATLPASFAVTTLQF